MATTNALNVSTAGIVGFDGASVFTATPMTQYEVVLGGSATDTLSQVSGLGTSGYVLTSNGAASAPTWQAGGGGGILQATGTLTSAQIKLLHTTPIVAVAAQGVGKVIVPISLNLKLNYGGTSAFSNGGAAVLALLYAQNVSSGFAGASSITQTATTFMEIPMTTTPTSANTNFDNLNLN